MTRRPSSDAVTFAFLLLAVCFLAYANGANDNFKGVASLYGSRTASYRTALAWATVTTAAGSLAAFFLATELLKKFSGKGLVPDALTAQPEFLLAVALGAGGAVLLATLLGFPISTTHGLTGALCGAGFVAVGGEVNLAALGKGFLLPLLLSPLLAVAVGAGIYLVFRFTRLQLAVEKELCVCVGAERSVLPVARPGGVFAVESLPVVTVATGQVAECSQRYAGRLLGLSAGRAVDVVHFLSAGAVSLARGLNDTPKIAALLLVAGALAMAVGGWLNARKVAETMAHKITGMNPGQGLAANLATAALVTSASWHGLPVSTTHVSVHGHRLDGAGRQGPHRPGGRAESGQPLGGRLLQHGQQGLIRRALPGAQGRRAAAAETLRFADAVLSLARPCMEPNPAARKVVPAGAVLHQKNAYVALPFTAADGPQMLEELRHRLMNPLLVTAGEVPKNSAAKEQPARLARPGEAGDSPVSKAALWAALRDCKDEQLYTADISVVDLGLVLDLLVRGETVHVLMTMPHRGRPRLGYFTFGSGGNSVPIQQRLLKVPGVGKVVVEQTWEPGWNANRLTEDGRKKLGLSS